MCAKKHSVRDPWLKVLVMKSGKDLIYHLSARMMKLGGSSSEAAFNVRQNGPLARRRYRLYSITIDMSVGIQSQSNLYNLEVTSYAGTELRGLIDPDRPVTQ